MKRKCSKKSRIMVIIMTIALAASVFTSVPTVKASDASDVASVDKKVTLELQSRNKTEQIFIDGLQNGAKITNLKSSNKKILTASWSKKYPGRITVKLKKTGKSVVSFDVVYNGQKTSLSTTVTVKKYVNPCAVFKVGNKNYTSKFKKDSEFYTSHKGTPKCKVNIKAAKNWKIETIIYINYSNYHFKEIKNKSNVRFSAKKGGYDCIEVQFKNKKTKETKDVLFRSKRK